MARIIIYQCDFCDYRADATCENGLKEPRKLWQIGFTEACDQCLKKAQNYLQHLKDERTT